MMRPLCGGLTALGLVVATLALAADRSVPDRPIPREQLRSGISYAGADVRALQADDFANPGMLWVARGEKLWRDPAPAGKSCASCHDDARSSMKGVATRYPRIDAAARGLVNLEGRINQCRTTQQNAAPHAPESDELLALTAYVAHQSRGLPVTVTIDNANRAHFERGREFYHRRMGQMNLACTHCHDRNAGRTLLAETISQGHGNAYPIYRLEWQKAGSLHRRFRSCLFGIRAEMLPYGAAEYLDLELFLAWRANGLAVETPGVRR